MISNSELSSLVDRVSAIPGVNVRVEYDSEALLNEGRMIIDTVRVTGLRGCGPRPMSALPAAEKLSCVLYAMKWDSQPAAWTTRRTNASH